MKKSFSNNLGLLLSARENFLNNFENRLFPMKKLHRMPILQPKPEVVAEPNTRNLNQN